VRLMSLRIDSEKERERLKMFIFVSIPGISIDTCIILQSARCNVSVTGGKHTIQFVSLLGETGFSITDGG
jgi:hypothetical protein